MSMKNQLRSVIPRKKGSLSECLISEYKNDLANRVKTKKRQFSSLNLENDEIVNKIKYKKHRYTSHTHESNDKSVHKSTNNKILNKFYKNNDITITNCVEPDELNCKNTVKNKKEQNSNKIERKKCIAHTFKKDEGGNCKFVNSKMFVSSFKEPTDGNVLDKENIQFDDILNILSEEFNDEEVNTTINCLKIFENLFQSEAKKYKSCIMNIVKKQFLKKINSSINTKCIMATPSEITLLKSYGLKMLNKIFKKYEYCGDIKNLNIKLPEKKKISIHYIESRLSRNPTKEQMILIKTMNPSVKLGTFSKEEDDLILKYWSKFKQEYNITNIQPFLSDGFEMALPHEQRFTFFRYISQELPNRLLFSVFSRFNTLLGNTLDHESFKTEEDRIILKVKNCDAIKDKLSVLSFLLSRSRLQICRRINTLKMEPLRTERIIWTDQLRQELFSSILRVTNTVKWRKLKKLKITAQTWNEIVKNFPQSINAEKARIYWDTWMKTMLFSKETLHYSSMKLSILEFLLTMKPKKWSDINWVTVSKKLFPRISNKFVGTLFHSWVKYNVPEEQKCDINKVLNYLTKNCKEDLMEKIQTGRDKPVPKLSVRGKDKLINLNKEKND